MVLLGLGIFAVASYSDAEPPEVTDLLLEPVEVSDEENLYLLVLNRGNELEAAPIVREDEPEVPEAAAAEAPAALEGGNGTETVTKTAPAEEERDWNKPSLRERLAKGEDWTPGRLARWTPALDQLAADARKIATRTKAQGAIPQSPADFTNPSGIRQLMRHLGLAAWAQYHSGRQGEAVDTLLTGWDIGQKLTESHGTLIDYLTGIAIKGIVVDELHDMAARTDVKPETLRQMSAGFRDRPNGRDGYEHALRNEFTTMHGFLLSLSAEQTAAGGPFGREFQSVAKTRVLYPLVYKPNHTVAMYADVMRQAVQTYEQPLAEREALPPVLPEKQGLTELLRPYNLMGRVALWILVPTMSKVTTTRQLSFSRRSTLEAFVALRLYHLERGSLPATLEELVPGYLPAVPVDYIDRTPIRYGRDVLAVWSLGDRNLKVLSADQKMREKEVYYRLDFAAPPVGENPEPR